MLVAAFDDFVVALGVNLGLHVLVHDFVHGLLVIKQLMLLGGVGRLVGVVAHGLALLIAKFRTNRGQSPLVAMLIRT